MIWKKMYLIAVIVIATLFFVSSCNKNKDEDEKIHLESTLIDLIDIGRIKPYEFRFDLKIINDKICQCKIRTRHMTKDDEIESINAILQGNNLNIDIISYPFDWDCNDCFTAHDITFNLIGINKGKYNISVKINGSPETPVFSYNIE
ncbi:MAG: hypothetical protein RSA66_11375 [Muribaculaceae bacterium]